VHDALVDRFLEAEDLTPLPISDVVRAELLKRIGTASNVSVAPSAACSPAVAQPLSQTSSS
jgi:hypothetical protein